MKEGEETGVECPKCGTMMIFEMSFQDQFSYTSGHYTIDYPLNVCPKCDEYFLYEPDIPDERVDY